MRREFAILFGLTGVGRDQGASRAATSFARHSPSELSRRFSFSEFAVQSLRARICKAVESGVTYQFRPRPPRPGIAPIPAADSETRSVSIKEPTIVVEIAVVVYGKPFTIVSGLSRGKVSGAVAVEDAVPDAALKIKQGR
jgi:hypothetical protein